MTKTIAIILAGPAACACLAAILHILDGKWPGSYFWVRGLVLYWMVTLPILIRQRKKDNGA